MKRASWFTVCGASKKRLYMSECYIHGIMDGRRSRKGLRCESSSWFKRALDEREPWTLQIHKSPNAQLLFIARKGINCQRANWRRVRST
jgi:hypothetical protein